MKKKLLLLTVLVIALTCIFAISVSAAEPDTSKETVQLKDSTVLPIWDTDGDALIWYKSTVNTEDGYANYDYIKAQDEAVTYTATNWQGSINGVTVNQTSDVFATVNGVKYDKSTIVVFNIDDPDVAINAGNAAKNGASVNCLEKTFQSSASIEYVYLRSDFVSFQAGVFQNCSNLQYLNFEDLTSLNNISSQVFSGCSSLLLGKTLDLSNTVITNVQSNVFANTGFTQIILPSTVKTLSNSALESTKITSFHIPETITSFGSYVFKNCKNLETITGFVELFERGVLTTKIPGSTFESCEKLSMPFENGILPQGITEIGSYAFYKCALEEIVIPNGTTTIGSYAFNGCTSLTSVSIPAGITLIGNRSFQNCSALASLEFRGNAGENATIEIAAFEGCYIIGDVAIPEGFTTFGEAVFQAAGVTNLTLPSTLKNLHANGKQFNVWGFKVTNEYKLKSVTGLENTQITSIPNSMFRGQTQWNADVVRLPNTVQSTGEYSFADCAFYNIYLGAGLTSLGNETFTACANLKNVYMPGTITTFGNNPFYGKGVYFLVTSSNTTYLDTINSKAGSSNDYVSYADYKANPDNYKSGKYIIYGLNLCETFYKGVHDTEGVVGVNQFKGDKYVTDYICVSGCNRNCGMQAETKLCGPLFTNKGYSKIADGTMFTYGVVINEENIAKYVATGKTFNYGVIIGAANFDDKGNLIETNAIIDNTGKALINNSIVVDFSNVELENFTIYNVKMQGIETEAQRNLPIYCCAYIIDGDAVSYMGNEVTENAKTISSSAITVIETTTTTPPVAGDDNA